MRAASSGGEQSGKNGFNTSNWREKVLDFKLTSTWELKSYSQTLNVNATIACEHGRTIMHSIHKRINAKNGPKVVII
jgi:hypothetical protein